MEDLSGHERGVGAGEEHIAGCDALFGVLQAALGLRFDAQRRTLFLDRPTLPRFIGTIKFAGLRIGNESLDLELHQHENSVGAHVVKRSGDIDLVVMH